MKRFFLDTEFIEAPSVLELISIALVCEDGRELYAVSSDFDPEHCNDWVKAHVLPKLPPRETWIPKAEIARRVRAFVGDDVPEVWGYFADYDWVVFCWLFGDMMALPEGWPCFCLDLKQSMHERGIVRASLPPEPENAHDALEDARWLRDAHQIIYGGGAPC
ncbi:3'-5' exoribonuclease domain-containing protein [Sorangium sp. So ce233]|uniref:3'-5' exoribonuclease domain-containing protein n=1 Tax=Sorangium sp. So ce233 TaxID=3133290 RepID=UPI003F63DDF3